MRRPLAFATALFLVSIATPAHAGTIVDPIIGVRGEGGGSPPVTDSSQQQLNACSDPTLTGFYCAFYENNLDTDIYSMDMIFYDTNGEPIPNTVPFGEGTVSNYQPAPQSDFQLLRNLEDGFTVRLCAAESPAGQDACGVILLAVLDPVIPAGSSLSVFSNTPGFVSVVGVNGNPNVVVPEPATLMLLGVGLATAGRRFRRRPQ